MKKMRMAACAIGLSALAVTPSAAYDGLEKDVATCTQGAGKLANSAVVTACTRLIDNAQTENETVGFFYAMRATANDDRQSNCHDARKVLELIDDPAVVAGANQLVEANC